MNGDDLIARYNSGVRDFTNTYLCEIDLECANIPAINFTNANLEGAHLIGSNLRNSILMLANLTGAKLDNANLDNVNAQDVNLYGASLCSANLIGAFLNGAMLQSANLENANLSKAFLSGCNLKKANLKGVNLINTRLDNSNLSGAILDDFSHDKGLAAKVLRRIKENPESLDQSAWHSKCYTKHCVAGWAVALSKGGGQLESMVGTYAAATFLLGGDNHPFGINDDKKVIPWLESLTKS